MSWLWNRWVIVPVTIAVVTVAWNGWVSLHDNGIVAGRVVAPDGAPVAGAEVVLLEQNVTTFSERARTTTDGDGRFRFADNRTHHAQIFAEKAGFGRSERQDLRLWFKSQDTSLKQPLVLTPGTG
jgi:hypothetical protein